MADANDKGFGEAAPAEETVRRRAACVAGPAVHVRWCVDFGLGRVYPSAGTGVCVGADREESQSQSQSQSRRQSQWQRQRQGIGLAWCRRGDSRYKRSGLMGQSGSDGQGSHSWLHLSVSSDVGQVKAIRSCHSRDVVAG